MVERAVLGRALGRTRMPLDESTRRLVFLLQRDMRRIVEREAGREARGEEVKYDSVSRLATWETRRGDVIGKWFAEILATYDIHEKILRWAWAGKSTTAMRSHGDHVFKEGQARDVPQLSMSMVAELDEEEASTLAWLGGLVAGAEGMHVRRRSGELDFVGLFDTPRPMDPASRAPHISVPPPPVRQSDRPQLAAPRSTKREAPAAPRASYRSLPPITEIYEPRGGSRPPRREQEREEREERHPTPAAPSVREPGRALFLPVANAAIASLVMQCPGYLQALFVVSVEGPPEKRRLVVQLVALDAQGMLRALDPAADVVDASARMIEADRADGNGPWRKLSARIAPKPNGGATLHVEVS